MFYLDKTSIEAHRESVLLEELVRIAEERNIASFPPPASGIPGKYFIDISYYHFVYLSIFYFLWEH